MATENSLPMVMPAGRPSHEGPVTRRIRHILAVVLLGSGVQLGLADEPAAPNGLAAVYDPEVLSGLQFNYQEFLNKSFRMRILPALEPTERQALEQVHIRVLTALPGREISAFESDVANVRLSATSLKLVNDLNLANVWLGRNGFDPSTVDDYVRLLANWVAAAPPPRPLAALGVPQTAREDKLVDLIANDLTRSAFLYIVSHELGHVIQRQQTPSRFRDPSEQQRQALEEEADAFAMKVMERMQEFPLGAGVLVMHYFAFMPNPAYFPDTDSYAAAVQKLNHPLWSSRLRALAGEFNRRADRFSSHPADVEKLHLIAVEIAKLSAFETTRSMQEALAKRTRMLNIALIAPRRRGELLGRPIGMARQNGPFEGRFSARLQSAGETLDAEVILVRNEGSGVVGAVSLGSELLRIEGEVTGAVLNFRGLAWDDRRTTGTLRREGTSYQGKIEGWPGPSGAKWTLRDATESP